MYNSYVIVIAKRIIEVYNIKMRVNVKYEIILRLY